MVVGMSLPMSALAALAIVLSRFVTPDFFVLQVSDSKVNSSTSLAPGKYLFSQSALGTEFGRCSSMLVTNRLSTEF